MSESVELHQTSVSTTVPAPAVVTAGALTNVLLEWVGDVLDPRPVLGLRWGGPDLALEAQVTAMPAGTSDPPEFVHIGRVLMDDFGPGTHDHDPLQPLQFQVAIDAEITTTPTVLTFSVTPAGDVCLVTVTHDGWPSGLRRLAGPQAWEEHLERLPAVALRIQDEAVN